VSRLGRSAVRQTAAESCYGAGLIELTACWGMGPARRTAHSGGLRKILPGGEKLW